MLKMSEVIKTWLSLSFSGTLLIIVLMLFQPLYKDRISKSWQYYIWLVVIARLLCPWTLDISLSMPSMDIFPKIVFKSEKTAIDVKETASDIVQNNVNKIYADNTSDNVSKVANSTDNTETPFIQFLQPLSDTLHLIIEKIHIIWLVVALFLFMRKITIYQSFARYVYASSIPVNDIDKLEYFGNIIEQSHVKGTIGLYVNDVISSPMIIGFFHPRIIITTAILSSENSFRYTILHELVHYKRMDMLYKWLIQIVLCLHWFNPFVYLMEHKIRQVCELSCDERVIKKLDVAAKREYGDTLLDAIHTGGLYKSIPTSVTLNESKELLKGRLEAIMKYKEKSKFTKAITAILTILFCTSAVIINVYKTPSTASANVGSIIYENGEYYIMAKGASEADKPSGGTTDGSIAITIVRKDSYTTISPFSNMTKLVDEVESQCKYMLKHENGKKEDADMFMEAAKEIQSIGQSGQKHFPKLNKKSVTLQKGSAFSLKMINTDKKAIWTSSDENVAVIDQTGRVSVKETGKAKINAKIGNIIYRCKVKVTDKAAKKKYAKDYKKKGIIKKSSAYYYKNKRLRIFMDLKTDNSFVYFKYDEKGEVDLCVRRAENGSISKVEYMTSKEAAKILDDMDIIDSTEYGTPTSVYTYKEASRGNKKDAKAYAKVTRMLKEELPDSVTKIINSCNSDKWYLVSRNGRKYIYYDGLPYNYAFKTTLNTSGVKVNVYDMGAQTGNYVLLEVKQKQNKPLNIYYNDSKISYKKITADTKSV